MHTDFPLPRLYVKPQDMVDLNKKYIQMLLHFLASMEDVQDFLIKAH